MIKKVDVKQIFNNYFNGAENFITPTVVGYECKEFEYAMLLIEISKGDGLFNNEVFGATFLLYDVEDGTVTRRDLGISSSEEDVRKYIDSLTWKDVINSNKFGETRLIKDLMG